MLLFDQNISFRILRLVADIYPGSVQVRREGLEDASDRQIWAHAKRKRLAIVTFDQDYLEIAALLGPPPKVILLRKGTSGTLAVSHLLREHRDRVIQFLEYNDPACPALLEIP